MKQIREGQEKSGRVGGKRLLCIVVVYKSILIGCRMNLKLMMQTIVCKFDLQICKLWFANRQDYAPR